MAMACDTHDGRHLPRSQACHADGKDRSDGKDRHDVQRLVGQVAPEPVGQEQGLGRIDQQVAKVISATAERSCPRQSIAVKNTIAI
jgi:hypothetical protein